MPPAPQRSARPRQPRRRLRRHCPAPTLEPLQVQGSTRLTVVPFGELRPARIVAPGEIDAGGRIAGDAVLADVQDAALTHVFFMFYFLAVK
jgi:hypothetical protein